MNVGELFAGIGGFGLAARNAGCRIAWAVEFDPFARTVYSERLGPHLGLWDDVRTFPPNAEWPAVDCITAGFPCQDVSVAGKRKGLIGERTGLFWEVIRIARRLRPRWLLVENVPGLLTSHRGRDFETVLAALDELGYGVAWRVLDAQFWGVPQRRRRVFVVGHLGAPCPAEVLFEPEGVPGDSAPGRASGEAVAGSLGGGAGRRGWCDDTDRMTFVAQPLRAGRQYSDMGDGQSNVVAQTLAANMGRTYAGGGNDSMPRNVIAHALSAEGADASEDGTGRGTPIVASVVSNGDAHSGFRDEHGIIAGTVRTHRRNNSNPVTEARELVGVHPRRLTPRECERLQGFPDDWTLVDGASDSARYRVLGNAVAVPVVEWILRRMAV